MISTARPLRRQGYGGHAEATLGAVKEIILRVLDANEPQSAICVVSSREKLEEANHRLGERSLTLSDILV